MSVNTFLYNSFVFQCHQHIMKKVLRMSRASLASFFQESNIFLARVSSRWRVTCVHLVANFQSSNRSWRRPRGCLAPVVPLRNASRKSIFCRYKTTKDEEKNWIFGMWERMKNHFFCRIDVLEKRRGPAPDRLQSWRRRSPV